MEQLKETIKKFFPVSEEFLTSELMEETQIEIDDSEQVGKEEFPDEFSKGDIFLFTRDTHYDSDFIVVMEKEWYGILSSVMLGVEEKSNNEVTRDLLQKFSAGLSETVQKSLKEEGFTPEPEDFKVYTIKQAEKDLAHEEYFRIKLKVNGLADESLRIELLIGDPEQLSKDVEESAADEQESEKEVAGPDDSDKEFESEQFEKAGNGEGEPGEAQENAEGHREPVITGRHIEFDEFDEEPLDLPGGEARSMDLLKDVEMDVSVELGRIELPLGKVLHLSKGSVIELEKLAGEPVDVLVNGQKIAHGEVVVIDEHFGVRISNLITTRQRLAKIT